LVSSGDDAADKKERARFTASYKQRHKVTPDGAGGYTLVVGASGWPLPIPLVKNGSGWSFDAEKGKQEVLFRRIGRNEITAALSARCSRPLPAKAISQILLTIAPSAGICISF
jgi:hypothetical protein